MFYFVSCLIGFCVVLGLSLSLFSIDQKELISENNFYEKEKSKLFEDYLKIQNLYKEGQLEEREWEDKKQNFLNEYTRLLS